MIDFNQLSKPQLRVFEQVAVGNDIGHPPRTLESLKDSGYLQSELQYLSGWLPVAVCKYSVPIPVHIAWCQWCSERLKGEDDDLE